MKPRDYQLDLGRRAYNKLKEHMIVYLACEERTGKTLSALVCCELTNVDSVLIITKKNALKGWYDTLRQWSHQKKYFAINYHMAHTVDHRNYDLVILDESHNYISGVPKPGKLWKDLQPICANKPLIYISATPYPQGPQMLYHQFKLSSWGPWRKHSNFYKWFQIYGKPYTLEINGIKVPQYDRVHRDMVLGCCEDFFITKTRAELGFEHEPVDKIHEICLHMDTKRLYNGLLKDEIYESSDLTIVCDTASKMRTTLHQIEGGTIKDVGLMPNTEKIDFILENFGDSEDLVIMYNFILERTKLEKYFKKATILQATSNAEGVDLHKFKHLVIYSQDYSTARHTQRRARQANLHRKEPIIVHHLLVKRAISEQVYKTVNVNKKNFVDSVFRKVSI